MASRGSKLSRSIAFFREADLDEARVAFQLVKEIMESRLVPEQKKLPLHKRARRKHAGEPAEHHTETAPAAPAEATAASA